MPAAIDAATRGDIVFYAALGYSQEAIADEAGVSRRTVRKYLDRARETVERSARPRRTLCAILRGEYDWEQGERAPDGVDTGDLMSL
jgi:transposase